MKKLIQCLYLAITLFLFSCADLAPAGQVGETAAISTATTVISQTVVKACNSTEATAVDKFVTDINTAIAPNHVNIFCPSVSAVDASAATNVLPLTPLELDLLKNVTMAYCTNQDVNKAINNEMSNLQTALSFIITCK